MSDSHQCRQDVSKVSHSTFHVTLYASVSSALLAYVWVSLKLFWGEFCKELLLRQVVMTELHNGS